ncbi:deoxyribose-phosphate aldolase, partial [Staphylococcus chromogenes MU 970]
YPTTGEQPVITVDDPTTLPDGQTAGNYTVPVTVTYPDGSQDHISVPVTVTPSQASTYNPTAGVVNNPYGTPTTEAQVTSEVTVTGYPSTGPHRKDKGAFKMNFEKYIDHTLLKPESTRDQIDRIIEEAKTYHFKSICINPTHVAYAHDKLADSDVLVCTVIGFPLGASTKEV